MESCWFFGETRWVGDGWRAFEGRGQGAGDEERNPPWPGGWPLLMEGAHRKAPIYQQPAQQSNQLVVASDAI
jgi:hypothetical protein